MRRLSVHPYNLRASPFLECGARVRWRFQLNEKTFRSLRQQKDIGKSVDEANLFAGK